MGCHALLQGTFLTGGSTYIPHISCTDRWLPYHKLTWKAPSKEETEAHSQRAQCHGPRHPHPTQGPSRGHAQGPGPRSTGLGICTRVREARRQPDPPVPPPTRAPPDAGRLNAAWAGQGERPATRSSQSLEQGLALQRHRSAGRPPVAPASPRPPRREPAITEPSSVERTKGPRG